MRLVLHFTKENGLYAEIIVEKYIPVKDFEVFKKIICKAEKEKIDLLPIAKFLKNKDVNSLLKNDWVLDYVKFTASAEDILAYYKKQKAEGGTLGHAQETMFSHISISQLQIINFQLMMDHKIVPCSMKGLRGGYVLAEYKNEHELMIRNKCSSFDDFKTKTPDKLSPINTEKIEKTIKLSKAEGKRCRNKIISKAGMSNICRAGFKPEFVSTLSDNERAYLNSLSNLQIKFMVNAITKKFSKK